MGSCVLWSKTIRPVVLQHLLSTGTWSSFLFIEKWAAVRWQRPMWAKEVYMVLGVTTWGIANATNSLVSNLLGQAGMKRCFRCWKILRISIGFSMIFCIAILVFPDLFTGLFTNDPRSGNWPEIHAYNRSLSVHDGHCQCFVSVLLQARGYLLFVVAGTDHPDHLYGLCDRIDSHHAGSTNCCLDQ